MKLPPVARLLACVAVLFSAGCANIDLARESDPQRVLNGTVTFPGTLSPGTQVLVRVIEVSTRDLARPANQDLPLPVADRARSAPVERVLGEQTQTLANGAHESVPFRVEYQADDTTLRHGLNVDVRISIDGKVRFRTVHAHALTLNSSPYPQEVKVQAVQ